MYQPVSFCCRIVQSNSFLIIIIVIIIIIIIIIIFIEETFSQTWFSKRTSEIKIKTNKCKSTKNIKFIKHLN